MKAVLAAAAVLAALAAVLLLTPARSFLGLEEELPVYGQVPAFSLVADDGSAFDSKSLDGQVWLASFLYTSCPGPCPRLVERLKGLRRRVEPARLRFVSISVDPEADTPPVLAEYKIKQGIREGDRWTFATGKPDEVTALVQRGFVTGISREGTAEEGAVTHGTRVALVDGDQRIRGFYSTESDEELARLEADAASLAD